MPIDVNPNFRDRGGITTVTVGVPDTCGHCDSARRGQNTNADPVVERPKAEPVSTVT